MISAILGKGGSMLGANPNEDGGSYTIWIYELATLGMLTFNDLLKQDPAWNNKNYWDFMESFKTKEPGYDKEINYSLKPQIIETLNINCK